MKKAIVFGATSGIGKSLTEILIKEGYQIAVTGRRLDKLTALKKQYPASILVKQNDIQDVADVEKVFNEIVAEFGSIDLVVQSSGVGYVNPKLEWEQQKQTINTNVLGCTRLYILAYNLFKKQQFGQLVGISSIASLRGNRSAPDYFASKAYQKAYLESLYIKTKSIQSKKVYITEIRPGFVDTDMAKGDGQFWVATKVKAAKQIYGLIKRKKSVGYVTKRWQLISLLLKIVPNRIYKRM